MIFTPKIKYIISVVLIWLFTISGIIGILSKYESWFLALTPLNLLIYFIIVIWNAEYKKPKLYLSLCIPFVLGFIVEALGVNYGLIFGSYTYGENLGYKILGVPFIICINWALLTAITADVSKVISKKFWIASFIGGLLMMIMDVIIEVTAPRFDFWEFENNEVPLQNYIGWLFTAFIAHIGYQYLRPKTEFRVSWHILASIVVFFVIFLFV